MQIRYERVNSACEMCKLTIGDFGNGRYSCTRACIYLYTPPFLICEYSFSLLSTYYKWSSAVGSMLTSFQSAYTVLPKVISPLAMGWLFPLLESARLLYTDTLCFAPGSKDRPGICVTSSWAGLCAPSMSVVRKIEPFRHPGGGVARKLTGVAWPSQTPSRTRPPRPWKASPR